MKLLGTLALAGILGLSPMYAAAKEYSLKVSISVGEKDPMYSGSVALKEAVEKRTNGKLKIDIYPSGQLGSVEDIQELAMFGENIAVLTDSGRLSLFAKELGVIGVAYAAKDYEEMKRIIETDVFKNWETKLLDSGLRILSFNWFQGSRSFMTNKEVRKPEDLKSTLIRTPGAPVWSESIKALGAMPVSLPWSETYTAMQQGTIDGFEAQIPATYAASLHETVKYMAETEHFQLMTAMVVSNEWFESLPKDFQKILLEETKKAGSFASDETNQKVAGFKKIMKEQFKVQFIPVDKTPFIENAKPVFKKLGYEKEYQELQDALNK
ncbi:TRAP transporter substrate-binding protein DctP [Vibrio sp. S9_S30]|uniref:C4-dicarboxylate TRAP transporter substrate-binding protein n=1 Tax=Vibrio sp. S9_S30 TaxID=2720226 RepID=UPI001681085B|nr:C4-dicarboxylate TRAP transporter substrate-binding protein [Vibrio sp. S9_S30]MBD1556946.1 TRAP transporter substrate-binding protein DctP [Vibrio sp. S9_S30]